ncbi:DNA polymerase III subunit delta [Sphingosinicella sp. LHD-64]|uniref:DNA polymerase III subunit delta n=1 Tax=Sphingosinicella sp. LHD-64 TaxID=3072139 RepID=UPI00281064D5|nr:DNA polymerase III subunit delta [Sphingosinicella sp. LHD-64]MDQ8757036.1 DNA polymerase III subunit delta [Sphingosinicella sp. LHD-64]
MKANRGEIERALRNPGETRFFLLHGPDEAGSRALMKMLGAAMGEGAERIDLTGSELKADPARLADEAAALSMFGDRRWILVEQVGDEVTPAVKALAEVPAAGNLVVIVAGALRPASRLLKLALAEKSALAFASYLPDARDYAALVGEPAQALGLEIRSDVARRIAESCGGNRALIAQELGKYALFVDATPGAPKPLDHDAIDALGADSDEGDLSRLVDSVLGGDATMLESEIGRLRAEGQEGIALTRAMLRRMTLLGRLRAEVDQGMNVGAVMASSGKSLFWKDKDAIAPQLGRWRGDLIARVIGRLIEAERQVMMPGGPGIVAAETELFAICRQAGRLR